MNEITERARNLRKNQTPAEKELWQEIRKQKLGKMFRRQYPIRFFYGNKKRYFITDFFCKSKQLVIEIDGKIHDDQKEYDLGRDYIIKELGFNILRFTNEEIFNYIDYVLKKIKEYL